MRGRLLWAVTALTVVLLAATTAVAQPPARAVQWKVIMDWIIGGEHTPFMVALEKGYFRQEGISVTIDRGFGSIDTVTKVASGIYDVGFADINPMIEFNAKNPGRELVAVAVLYDATPYSVITLKREGITRPIELYGKRLGAPAGSTPRVIWPVFARAIGMHPASVEWVTMAAPLREPFLIRGDVNAVAGFYYSSYINLVAARVDPADIVAFMYNDYGLPLYGNAIVVAPALLQKEPEAVRGFIRAAIRGLKDTITNPDEGISFVKRKDPLLNEAVEKERLLLTLRTNVLTTDARSRGIGGVRVDRLIKSIDILAESLELPRKPTWQQVFTDKFLPPRAERMLPGLR